jgi:protease I
VRSVSTASEAEIDWVSRLEHHGTSFARLESCDETGRGERSGIRSFRWSFRRRREDIMRIAALVGPGFEDSEFRIPHDRFRAAGHEVVVVGTKEGETLKGYKGKETITTEKGLDEARPESFDALFLPGGQSPDHLRADDRAVEFVKGFRGKPIFAVCHGPQLLITASMVRGRKMTAWKTIQVDLRHAGAEVEDEAVIVDRNLVTSRKPEDLDVFARESIALLDRSRNAKTAHA